MLRATGRYEMRGFPFRGLAAPNSNAEGLRRYRRPQTTIAGIPTPSLGETQFVVIGREFRAGRREELESALNGPSPSNIPPWAWAEHGARHPLGEDFGGFRTSCRKHR